MTKSTKPSLKQFILQELGSFVVQSGLTELINWVKNSTGFDVSPNSPFDLELIGSYKAGIPNTYKRYGILFDVYSIPGGVSPDNILIVPVGYGQTPAHAIINERTITTDAPELSASVASQLVERKLLIAKAASDTGQDLRVSGLWLEYNPSTATWRTAGVDRQEVEAIATQQLQAAAAQDQISALSVGLEKVRSQAIAWNRIFDQYSEELLAKGMKTQIQNLVSANESMARQIEEAVKSMRRAQSGAGFFSFLNMLSASLNLAAALYPNAPEAAANFVAMRDYQKTVIERVGDKWITNHLSLKDKVLETLQGTKIYPEVTYEKTIGDLL